MKINKLSIPVNYSVNNYFNNRLNKFERTPNTDVVSFSAAKPKQRRLKPRVQTAVDFSQRIIEKAEKGYITLEDVFDASSKYINGITVYPMSKLKEEIPDAENYSAYFFAGLGKDFKPSSEEIFVSLPQPNCDKTELLLFAMNSAHEFTHVEQMETLESFNQLKAMSKGDYDYANAIMSIGDGIFSSFDTTIQAYTLKPIMDKCVDVSKLRKYGGIVPQSANIDRKILPLVFGTNSETEMQAELRKIFDSLFEKTMKQIEQNQPEILDMFPSNESREALKKKIKAYCAQKALDERESYTTEAEVARKFLNTDSTLNVDAFTMYYDILTKSFG